MKNFIPLFQAILAFAAVLTGLGFTLNLQLAPVKKDIAALLADVSELKAGQAEIKRHLKLNK